MLDWSRVIPNKIKDIKPSGIRKFFDLVEKMPDAISLGVGEPDFVTPYHIRKEAIQSIQRGETQYTSNRGLLSLRQEIALYLKERFSLTYQPDREVLVTVGGSEAIDLAVRAITEEGDEILIPDPSYVSYAPCIEIAGGVPVRLNVAAETRFCVTAEELERRITSKTKAIILSYPNNPTGAVMTKEDYEEIVPVILKHDLVVISDEIYAELSYGHPFVSIASLSGMYDRTIVVGGFSKAFAMTGWRLGYACAPKEIISMMTKIHQFTIMCASTMSQKAALAALKQGRADHYQCVEEMKEQYDRRRRLMYDAFIGMGLECYEPLGAFYEFPSVKRFGMTGDEFAERLLDSQRVAVVPGSAFGEFGKYHVRCCYAVSVQALQTAFDRMRAFISTLTPKY